MLKKGKTSTPKKEKHALLKKLLKLFLRRRKEKKEREKKRKRRLFKRKLLFKLLKYPVLGLLAYLGVKNSGSLLQAVKAKL